MGYSRILTYAARTDEERDRVRRATCRKLRKTQSCDEYPYASTEEGNAFSSVWNVPLWENRRQGGYLKHFYDSFGSVKGTKFCVQVLP
jgi:hypothetical protein